MDLQKSEAAQAELRRLCETYTETRETGFAVDLRRETDHWYRAVSALGRREAYRLISSFLCEDYLRRYGRPFLFCEECVAFEIAYHADAYFWARALAHHGRHITTLLFAREKLLSHCEVVDISVADTASFRQRAMFDYAAGVRDCYRNTPADPFAGRRRGLFSRFLKPFR